MQGRAYLSLKCNLYLYLVELVKKIFQMREAVRKQLFYFLISLHIKNHQLKTI
jgi:hypothetical protein